MGNNRTDSLRSLLNASGFVFQLGVEQIVRDTSGHQWEVLSREHPWQAGVAGLEGYVDLLLSAGMMRMVIECKRVRDADWVFVVTSDRSKERARTRCLWADRAPGYDAISGWYDFRVDPPSLESEFCAVRGSGETDAPMLERVASSLLRALDAVADQELSLKDVPSRYFPRVYMPVIVTTARLSACICEPSAVSLVDGQLSGGEFRDVPWIRFRKSLTAGSTPPEDAEDLVALSRESERTITVIAAEHFGKYLQEYDVGDLPPFKKWPWVVARGSAARKRVT